MFSKSQGLHIIFLIKWVLHIACIRQFESINSQVPNNPETQTHAYS